MTSNGKRNSQKLKDPRLSTNGPSCLLALEFDGCPRMFLEHARNGPDTFV